MNRTVLSAAVLGIAAGAHAQVTLDGVADKSYGPAIVVQDTQTQFGDASDGLEGQCNGSELDGAQGCSRPAVPAAMGGGRALVVGTAEAG